MTLDQLYALYRTAHAEAWRVTEGGTLRAFEVSVRGAGVTVVERLILEFALHDATNGTPARAREDFDRAIRQAPELFGGLDVRAADGEDGAGAATWLDAA